MREIHEVVKRKQKVREDGFKRTKLDLGQVTSDELVIENLSDEELLKGLQSRKYTAQNVLQAFTRRVRSFNLTTYLSNHLINIILIN